MVLSIDVACESAQSIITTTILPLPRFSSVSLTCLMGLDREVLVEMLLSHLVLGNILENKTPGHKHIGQHLLLGLLEAAQL